MSELKPCPFCGKKPNPNWTDESYIECTNRKCSVYGYGMSTGDWNTRPIEDALRKRIAELEAGQRWIPVSERLPEDKKHYMTVVMNCYDGSRDIYRLRYYGNGDWFSWASESNVVTHWKEEPALPEVQE